MKRIVSFLLMGMLLSGCVGRHIQSSFPGVAIDSLCQLVFSDELPGAEVLIMQGDSVLFDHCYGGVESGSFFNIASCSKQFTAVAVLQLISQGKLQLDAPIHQYFPEFESAIWDTVEVRHLLAHSSGVPDERGYLTREQKIVGDEQLATEYLHKLDHLHFRPGTAYEYINPTYVLLGQLVERVSGQEFTSYVHEHIFEPAGMLHTAYFNPADSCFVPRWVHGYEYADTSDMPEERTATTDTTPHTWFEYDYGEETFFGTRPDGGIYSSVYELVAWEKWLRTQQSLLKDAWTPQTQVCGTWSDYQNRSGTYYGYGWFIEPDKDCIYHTGDNGGFKILIARYPASETLLIILANRADWDRYALKSAIEQKLFL